jgi:glycosyltransferase involved in cell wall biosynthesis
MSELASYFCQKENMEVNLVMFGHHLEVFYPVPQNLKIHNPNSSFNNKFRLLHTIKRLLFLRKTVKRINPDAVLSFGELWNSFVLISLAGLNLPVYISDRCSPEREFNNFNTLLRRFLYPGAAGIIAQTDKAKAIYEAKFRHNNISVIGNPIQKATLRDDSERENIVLMVGRLIKTKHQDKLIELFVKISKPGWKLVIVGYDHLGQNNSDKLKKLISAHNAEEIVSLEGKQNNVDEYYQKSKIFAFTSSSEGFPNVIGEALAAGLPVVAFDCVAGPSEMITDNDNGFLIPLFDYELFKEKLDLLMSNDDLRLRLSARAPESVSQFSLPVIAEKYLDFILIPVKS